MRTIHAVVRCSHAELKQYELLGWEVGIQSFLQSNGVPIKGTTSYSLVWWNESSPVYPS